jgi:hypothetical protein
MSCFDPEATHYVGCDCYEEQRNAELEKLRAQVQVLRSVILDLCLNMPAQEPTEEKT